MNKLAVILPIVGLAAALPNARAGLISPELAALNDSDAQPQFPMLHQPFKGPHEMVTATFLGVETSPVTPALSAQLGLPDNIGLVVEDILPGSPAATVLRQSDILLKLDDQWLVDQRQFSVLVRNHKSGDEVAITYVRGGKQGTATVKLASHEAPNLSEMGRMPFFQQRGGSPEDIPFGRGEMDQVLALMDRAKGVFGPIIINRAGGDQAALATGSAPGFEQINVDAGNSTLSYSDPAGTLDLAIADGKKTLVAKDPQGKELYSGPVDTPDQRKALPADVRQRLERLESMQGFSFKTDGDFKAEAGVVRPELQSLALPPEVIRDFSESR